MPIGAETFLSPALQPVFDKLFSIGEDLLSKLSGGELAKTLKQWKRRLKMIEAVLVDAEQKQFYSNAVKTWLDDLQDVAFDMEDILEHFAIQVHAHDLNNMDQEDFGIIGSFSNMRLSTLFSPMNPDIQSEIDDINERLEDIQTQTRNFGLYTAHVMQQQTIQIQTETLRNKRESTYIECEPKIYGRDDKKQEIIARLLKDDQSNKMNYVVIPIVGKGGIGKTTLAQYVYNDEQQLKGCFDIKAWVCVSDVFDIKRMTTTIFNAATDEPVGDFSNLNEAQDKLKQVLMSKKFLIVLDDVWNEKYDDWDKLKRPFRNAAKGSRVIMTTRNEKIAHLMIDESMNSAIVNLEGLPDDDCWCLFQQHVNVDSELAEMRDDIIKKCKGLPLAAKALGGLLKTTHKRHRNIILQSETWREDSNVLPVLRLSYNHLPSHLRRMFAYCSIFPKDYTFHEMEVVMLWMAQGFLPENQQGRLEDIGRMYFHDLVSRSLFEASQSSEEEFYMHDLTHDLALWAAGDICYGMCTSDTPQRDLNRIRHLFLTRDATTLGNQLPRASQWRTFYCVDESIEDLDLIQRFRYMRTLILDSDRINVLPECIGDLKHLRILILSSERLKELPKSINNLWNLQTLVICTSILEHVYVPNIGLLGKLRHLSIGGTHLEEMPMGIEKLTNLQSLDTFFLRDGCGDRIRDLKNLNNLHGKLTILGLESVLEVEDAKEAQLYKKDGLDNLRLTGGIQRDCVDDDTKRDVLEQLKPHTSIKQLELIGFSGLTFPTWLGNPCFSKMVGIILGDCRRCEYLPPLGQLPSLKKLLIGGMDGIKEIGAEFYGDLRCQNPLFPALESLKFEDMGSWEKWLHSLAHEHAFPCLKELSIWDCRSLEGELPPHLPSLRKLIIKKCNELRVSLQSLPLLEVLELHECIILFTDGAGCSSNVGAECLKELLIVDCPSLEGKPPLHHLPSLRKLEIDRCKELSFSLQSLPSLRLLKIYQCKKLSVSLQSLPLLEELELIECDILFTDGDGCSSDVGAECLKVPWELAYLTTLTIERCQSRISLPEGLLLPALQHLKFWNCQNMELPSQLHKYTSLKKITINGCPKVQEFPEEGFPINLEELTIEQVNIKQPVQELAVHHLHSLRSLKLSYIGMTPEDLSLPSSLSDVHVYGSQNLKTISSCTPVSNVTSLEVRHCPMFESFVGNWTLLSELVLEHCQSMECLPSQLHNFTSLKSLVIVNCPKLQGFPEGGLPINLEELTIEQVNIKQPVQELAVHHLHSLRSLTLNNVCLTPEDLSLPSSLSELIIWDSQNLETISSYTTLPNLTGLWVGGCPMFESLVGNFTSLSHLLVRNCPNFQFFAEDCLPRNLTCLILDGRIHTDKPIREWGLHLLSSLESLRLRELGSSSTDSVECIPSPDLQLPSSLSKLEVDGFQNLESISCSSFPNMITLLISRCPKFQSFGDRGLPPKILVVNIKECESLKPHLKIDPHGPIYMDQHKYSLL